MKKFRYTESAECWLTAHLDDVAPAVARLRAYMAVRGVDPEIWKGLELAVTEALNNAVLHGCKENEEDGITLRWNWSEDTLAVTVHDPGNFMPAPGYDALPEDPLAEGGRGHFLMANLMDHVDHFQADGHHVIELKKRLGPPSWSPDVLADTEATLESLTNELGSCYENLSAVFRFSEILATSRAFTEFSETVLKQLNTLVKAQQSYIRLETENKAALRQVVSVGDMVAGLPAELDKNSKSVEVQVFKSRIGQGIESSPLLQPGDPLRQAPGTVSICPIFFRAEVLGCLTVIRPNRGEIFLAAESALMRVAADFLGIAYVAELSHEQRKAEEMARHELEIASSIQQSLLPHACSAQAPYRTFGLCRSAREVGGDYFDVIHLENRGLLLVIADVMGKGMPAALLATIFRTAVRARLDLAMTPGKLLTEVNRQLAADLKTLDMFITAKLVFLSYEDDTLHYADAGHCPILIRRENASVLQQVQSEGFPLGVSDHYEYPAEVFQVEPGDAFIIITDGIYENLDEHGQASSFDYLMQQILEMKILDLPAFCNQVLGLSEQSGHGKPPLDDRTILVLKRDH